MRIAVRVTVLVVLSALLAGSMTACEPCDDPSQLWCPDQWKGGGPTRPLGGFLVRLVLVRHRTNRYSLAALAGALERSGVEVDLRVVGEREVAAVPGPATVCFSFHTADVPRLGALLAGLRRDDLRLVAGGAHATGDPRGTLALGFHAVVRGEGEEAIVALARGLAVPGLFAGEGPARRAPPVDLDAWPPGSFRHRLLAPVEISRGCPWACRFCQTPFLMGGRMRHRSLDAVVAWAEVLRREHTRDLRFITPDAFAWGTADGRGTAPARLEALLRAVASVFGREHVWLGSFPSEVRPENVTPETLGLVRAWCANDSLVIGGQSGSDRVLEALNRGHDVATVVRAVERTLAAGLRPVVDLLFGVPGETEADRVATRALARRLADMGATVHSHAFMPLSGTPLGLAEPPGVDGETRSLLSELAGRGALFGQWARQDGRSGGR